MPLADRLHDLTEWTVQVPALALIVAVAMVLLMLAIVLRPVRGDTRRSKGRASR